MKGKQSALDGGGVHRGRGVEGGNSQVREKQNLIAYGVLTTVFQ